MFSDTFIGELFKVSGIFCVQFKWLLIESPVFEPGFHNLFISETNVKYPFFKPLDHISLLIPMFPLFIFSFIMVAPLSHVLLLPLGSDWPGLCLFC